MDLLLILDTTGWNPLFTNHVYIPIIIIGVCNLEDVLLFILSTTAIGHLNHANLVGWSLKYIFNNPKCTSGTTE
jgi:hypothetical protein